jgi:hypothetical protein
VYTIELSCTKLELIPLNLEAYHVESMTVDGGARLKMAGRDERGVQCVISVSKGGEITVEFEIEGGGVKGIYAGFDHYAVYT